MAIRRFVFAAEGEGSDPRADRAENLKSQIETTKDALDKAKEAEPDSERTFGLKERLSRLQMQLERVNKTVKDKKEKEKGPEKTSDKNKISKPTQPKKPGISPSKPTPNTKPEGPEVATVPYEEGFITTELVCYYIPSYGGEKIERWRKKIHYAVADQDKCFDKLMLKTVGPFLYDLQGKSKWTPKKPRGVPPWDNF